MVVRAPSPHSGRSAALTRAAPARAATQPPPRPWPLLPLLLLLAGAAPAAAAVCAASGVCLAWSPVPTSSGAVTLTLSAPTATGSVALGFADTYGVMSPAAVWAVSVDPSTGAASLGSHTNAGYSSSGPNLPPHPAARLLGATYAAGVLNATFLVPLPASASAANVIWALDVGPASAGPLHQHSASGALATVVLTCGATGAQCGAAAGGQGAVLRSGAVETHHGGWSRLHGLALGGFTVTVFAAALLHAAGRASGVVRLAVEPSLGSVALPRLPPALRPSPLLPGLAWGLPETLLLAGYGTTYGLYLRAALRWYPATPGHAVGLLLAPLLSLALLPVSRRSPLLPALGASYERAAQAHRLLAYSFIVALAVHIGLSAKELGGASALGRAAATPSGRGNAYGTASAALAGAMALLASPPVRHRWFLLFKLSHLILFPAVLTLACLHATVLVGYVLPPAILYALDRLLSWWTARRELAGVATALPCGAVRLVVSTPAGFAVAPGQWAYVHVAAASGLEWHPFSLACAATETAAGSGAPATSVQFLIRARDKAGGGAGFGARLAALASPPAGAAVRVRLDGPLGRPPLPLHGYDCVLFVAGGVGVTPCVSHLAALVSLRGAEGAERRAAAAAGAKGDSGATTAAPPPPAAAPPPFRPQALRLLWVLPSAAPAAEWLPGWLPALAAAGVTVTVAVTRAGFGGGPLPAPVFGDGGDGDGGAGSVEYVAGRPDVGAAADLAAAAAGPGGCSAVFACGPRGLVEAAAGAAAAAGCAFAHETFGL